MNDVVTGLEQAWTGIRTLLHALLDDTLLDGDSIDGWNRPTPCPEWSVFDLAAHLGALESQFQGLTEPDVPDDPSGGIDAWTAAGVVARRGRPPQEIVAEIDQASALQVERLRSLDADGWQEKTMGPLGETTRADLARIRLFDIYVHLLDLRAALDQPLEPEREPVACAVCVGRTIDLAPWGAVKKAGLSNDGRIRLDLDGPGGRTADLVIDGGRGRLEDPEGDSSDQIQGSAPAFMLIAAGRPQLADAAGGVKALGPAATQLLDGYRMFA